VLMLEEKLVGARFYLQCNVFLGNALVLVLEGKLVCDSFHLCLY